jgi:hypothetical protein
MFQDMTMGHHSNREILSGGAEEDPDEMDIESMLSKSSKDHKGLNVPISSSYTSPW